MTAPPPLSTRLSFLDRGLLVIGFILTTAVTSLFAFTANDWAAKCQAVRSQRLSDVDRFRAVASEFEPLVATYLGAALKGADTKASKAAVEQNLRQQRAKLAFVLPYLDARGKESAAKFDEAAVNFVVESDKNPTGVNVGPLYQELGYIVANSQDLISASNRATGMEAIDVSTGRIWQRTVNCAQ